MFKDYWREIKVRIQVEKIKSGFEKNKFGSIIYFYCKWIARFIFLFNDMVQIRWRKLRFSQLTKNMEKFKNKYKGERCFILATGPSLRLEDVEKLSNEYTFVMNSFVKELEKISFKPSFYVIQDGDVYECLRNYIKDSKLPCMFLGRSNICGNIKKEFYLDCKWNIFPHVLSRNIFYGRTKKGIKFSDDASIAVYEGNNVVFSILQLAMYMGFKEIYLLGADCNYKPNINNFAEHGVHAKSLEECNESNKKIIMSYQIAYEYAQKHDIRIYNATRGGELEVFERVDLDKLLI